MAEQPQAAAPNQALLDALAAEDSRRKAIAILDAEDRRRAPSMGAGVARAAAQGATFGFADEAEAAIRALWDRGEGESFGSAYYRNRNQVRGQISQFQQAHPYIAAGSEIAGAFAVPGLGTARVAGKALASAPTLGGMALRGGGIGAFEGALYGAGSAAEVSDIPGEAATGALLGAGVGAVAPVAIDVARSALAPGSGAARRIQQAITRDSMTAEQIARNLDDAHRLGRPANIADVGGENLRRELEVAVQSPGAGADLAERALATRNKEQLTRLSADLVRGTGAKATDVELAVSHAMAARAKAAGPVYERAMGFAAELDDDLVDAYNFVSRTPLGKQALVKAKRILNVEKFEDAPLMERIDALKRGLDDVIGASQRSGDKAIARKALEVKHELVDLVDAVNPDYRKARQIWENSSSYIDAIDRGRQVLQPSFTASKLQMEVAGMSDAEREAFRIGVVDAVITRMRQQSAQEPNLLKIIRSPEIMDKLTAVMDPAQADRFRKIVEIEEGMWRTASQARGNSATARRLAVMNEQEKEARLFGAMSTLVGLALEGTRGLFTRALPAIPRAAKEKLLARQNALIAQRLLGTSADAALQGTARTAPSRGGAAAIAAGVAATQTGPLEVDIRDDSIPGRNPPRGQQ